MAKTRRRLTQEGSKNVLSYAPMSTYDDNKLQEKLMREFSSSHPFFERHENYYKALMSLNMIALCVDVT